MTPWRSSSTTSKVSERSPSLGDWSLMITGTWKPESERHIGEQQTDGVEGQLV